MSRILTADSVYRMKGKENKDLMFELPEGMPLFLFPRCEECQKTKLEKFESCIQCPDNRCRKDFCRETYNGFLNVF